MAEETKTKAATETEELRVVTFEMLEAKHKGKAAKVYRKIAQIGGFGDVDASFVGGRPPLDIHGLSVVAKESDNPEQAEDAKHRLSEIKKLLK